mgnify:CR=1 FL=1
MPRPGRMTTERAKDFKGTLRQLLAAMSKYKLSLVVVIVFAVLSTIFNIAGPKILAKATTALATGWITKLRGASDAASSRLDAVRAAVDRQQNALDAALARLILEQTVQTADVLA